MGIIRNLSLAGALASLAIGCTSETAPQPVPDDTPSAFAWPESLKVVGDGFPAAGAPCRRIGETAATVDMLDDSAALVGCPTRADADALGGKFLKDVDGVFLVSVPASASPSESNDALVAGTNYNATAQIPCAGYKGAAPGQCDAGVIRGGETGITVEVTLADGAKRLIFFKPDGSFLSFGTAQADGTAAMAISAKRQGDTTIAKLGTETYEIPDAFVLGG